MAKKAPRLNMRVHPDKVLIKITKDEWRDLFSIWINRANGERVQLFTDVEESDGYERRFKQNLSVGTIVAPGANVPGIIKGDVAIIDYLVTAADDGLVGHHYENKVIAISAKTTYHTEDSTPMLDGRKTWFKGDYENISTLLGIVRGGGKLMAFSPYVFLKFENPSKMSVDGSGLIKEEEEAICVREVISAHPSSGLKDGDKVLIKEADLFSRFIDKKEISVIFEADILGVV